MTLVLTSYRIPVPEAVLALFTKPPEEVRVGLIPNAKDYYAERARDVKIRQGLEYLGTYGLEAKVIDLNTYKNEVALGKDLQDLDMLWVAGGNTYCLRYAMNRSGFETVIHDLLAEGLVYGGESAGAIVAGTSLKGFESADNPEFAEAVIEQGLHLLPLVVVPHVGNPDFAEATEQASSLHETDDRIELTDTQMAIYDNGQVLLLEGGRPDDAA